MPVHPVKRNGKTVGWQWGNQKVYYGKGAREKAEKQGRAVYASGYLGGTTARRLLKS